MREVEGVSDKFSGDFSSRIEITRKIPGSPPEKWWYRARHAAFTGVIPETPQALSGTQGSRRDLETQPLGSGSTALRAFARNDSGWEYLAIPQPHEPRFSGRASLTRE